MNPTRDQILRYIETRFSGQRITANRELQLRCPLHADRTPSLSFNTEKGVWKCHAGCGEGGLIDFEQKLNGGTRDEAWHRVLEVMGEGHLFESQRSKPVAVYQYLDCQGRLLFEKLRYEPKRFVQRKPLGNGRYEYKLGDTQKVLYRLPEVLTANVVIITEGEKDADRVVSLNLAEGDKHARVAASTNFDGAGKWREEYSPYCLGKRVVILPDNDEPGRAHAEMVASSVSKFAAGVRIVNLPGLPEKGDVTDWLDAGHTKDDLLAEIKRAPAWRRKEQPHVMLVEGTAFAASAPPEVEWIIEGVIQKGGGGIVAGEPKVGKSFVALQMLLSVATGTRWFDADVPRRMKCALVSREDWAGLTQSRLARLFRGEEWQSHDLEGWLWINTRYQTPQFLVSDEAQLNALIRELQMEQVELCFFDVLRRVHQSDENDNTQMAMVLENLTRVQSEVGCAVGLVHHLNKDLSGSIFRRIRGASCLHGWCEWAIGASLINEDAPQSEWVRRLEFETKAGLASNPKYFRIEGEGDVLKLTEKPASEVEALGPRPLKTAASFMRRQM